jgi:SAM-dependent methyltransferase
MNDVTAPLVSWEAAIQWLLDHPDKAKRDLARACYFDETPFEAAKRFADSLEWAATRDLLPKPPGRALDIGAGRGISSFALANDGWTVDAAEPYESDLVGRAAIAQIAEASGLPITVVPCSAEELPFEDNTFDIVHCRQALHHAADLEKACEECLRVLRRGGMFLATREHVLSRESDLPIFLARHPLHALYGGENAFTLERYVAALRGPKPAKVEALSPYQSAINAFPSSIEAERKRLARIAGVAPEEIKDFVLRIRDHYDSEPGRLYSFRVIK